MNKTRIAIVAAVAVAVAAFFAFDLGQYLGLDYLKGRQGDLEAYHRDNPVLTALAYFAVYVAVTGLSLPGAAVMTLVGGAIFGLAWGTVIVSFASTIGATIAFLVSRFILRETVQRRFGESLRAVNEGIERDGAFYLFTLRLVPAFPFFVINLVMGLTPIRVRTYWWVSQIGMLPGTFVYVFAGSSIPDLETLADKGAGGVLSWNLLIAFALLGIFPLIVKKLVHRFRKVPLEKT